MPPTGALNCWLADYACTVPQPSGHCSSEEQPCIDGQPVHKLSGPTQLVQHLSYCIFLVYTILQAVFAVEAFRGGEFPVFQMPLGFAVQCWWLALCGRQLVVDAQLDSSCRWTNTVFEVQARLSSQ